jgi:hypothetical protein
MRGLVRPEGGLTVLKVGQEVWVVCRSVYLGTRKTGVYLARRRVASTDGETACLVQARDLGDRLEFWPAAEVHATRAAALPARAALAAALRAEGYEAAEEDR